MNEVSLNTRLSINHPYLIIVMGVAGSGKSTLAMRLATHFQATYLDADDFHSNDSKVLMSKGIPLTNEMRVPWVGRINERLNLAVINNETVVLAFSGLRKAHRELLRITPQVKVFIFLDVDKNIITARVRARQDHFMNPLLVDSQFATLESPDEEPDVITLSGDKNLELLVNEALTEITHFFNKAE
jgi:gluconokinase